MNINSSISLKSPAIQWTALTGITLLSAAVSSAQMLFDFEGGVQGWGPRSSESAVQTVVYHSPGYGATEGNDALEVDFTVTPDSNPFSWALIVTLGADAPQTELIANNVGRYISFDVRHIQSLTPGYNTRWELAAVVQPLIDEEWIERGALWPGTTTLDADFVTSVSFEIPDADFSQGLNIVLGVKAAVETGGDVVLFLDNFRVDDGPVPETIFSDYPAKGEWKNTSFIPMSGFGWIYDAEYPYVWLHDAGGWIYIHHKNASAVSFYAWHYENGGWIWSSTDWNGYYWDFISSTTKKF